MLAVEPPSFPRPLLGEVQGPAATALPEPSLPFPQHCWVPVPPCLDQHHGPLSWEEGALVATSLATSLTLAEFTL